MNPPTDRERPALSEVDLAAMVFPPDARFTFMDDPGEHDPCYVVMPGGAALPLNHHVGEGVDVARAKFIIDACNAALDRLATPNMGRVAQAVRRVLAAQMTGSIVERLTADITDAVVALGGGSVAEDLASPKPAITQGGVAVDHIVASTKGLAHHVDRDGVGWWNVKLTSAHVEELVALERLAGERGGLQGHALGDAIALNLMRWQCDSDDGDWPEDKCRDLLTHHDKQHSGDCTKQPWTCLRCSAETVYLQANELLALVHPLAPQPLPVEDQG